jgi:putative ABC transport system substrate-binding protein
MKKLLTFLLVAIIALGSLMGCSGNTESNNSTNTNSADSTDGTESKIYKIGIILPMDHPSLNQIHETIESELKAMDFGDNTEIEIDFQNANGDMSLLPTIMQDMLSDGVDMLVPIATPTAQAAMASTSSVPIVFSAVSNPIEAGLVTSFEETTANITGVSNSIAIEDIFKLASELTPDVKVFGFIYNSSEINSSTGIKRAKEYCDANGIEYKEATITGTADLQQVASSLVGQVDAFFTPNDNTVASAMATYMQIAMDAKIPTYVGADSMVADGALATVGIDYTVLGKQTAQMVARIIKGETIKENSVEQIAEYSKMINIGTAKDLGLNISDELMKEFVIIGE